jgi:hypothetical protein
MLRQISRTGWVKLNGMLFILMMGYGGSHFLDENDNIIDKEVESAISDYSMVDGIRTSLVEYENDLNIIIDAFLSTGAKPVFATTTSAPGWITNSVVIWKVLV